MARSMTATILDLTQTNGSDRALPATIGNGATPNVPGKMFDANAAIARLEESHDLVVVHLPELTSHAAAAVLSQSRPVSGSIE